MKHTTLPAPLLVAFVLSSLVLAVTPAPGVIYAVARAVTQGRRAGLASVAGVALDNLGSAAGASIGLAALFAVSSLALAVVKYTGAAYLIHLGLKALRADRMAAPAQARWQTPRLGPIVREGFAVALLNPKTALFFAAFLPQFVDPDASALSQSLLYGAAFVLIAVTTDTLYVLAAGAVLPVLGNSGSVRALGRYAMAGVFIGLGVYAAATGVRRPH